MSCLICSAFPNLGNVSVVAPYQPPAIVCMQCTYVGAKLSICDGESAFGPPWVSDKQSRAPSLFPPNEFISQHFVKLEGMPRPQ